MYYRPVSCVTAGVEEDAGMDEDERRWDQRYRDQAPATPRPPDALLERDDLLGLVPTEGRALDIASGTGAQTLWLALRGLHVTALDVSGVALDLVGQAASSCGVETRVTTRRFDADRGVPDDLTEVDVIVCQRFRDPRLYPTIIDRLRPGGLAIVTVLSAVGVEGPVGAFHAPAGELLAAFTRDSVELVETREGDGEASVVVRRR
jgi:SAM-dependent methyltransferase